MSSLELKPVASNRVRSRREAFTLIEMLTVIVIIGIMATLAIPALKGITQSNGITSAARQMLDDIALARQKAIANRTRVYMIFIPPNFWANPPENQNAFNNLQPYSKSNVLRLSLGQYNTYALYAEHQLGDQPGTTSPRYLTKWKTLPDGMIIETNMFRAFLGPSPISEPELIAEFPALTGARIFPVNSFTNDLTFPFPPTELTPPPPSAGPPPPNPPPPAQFRLPYIAFDSQGHLLSGRDQFIPLARASILANRDANLQPNLSQPADVIEPHYREATATNYMLIHIDAVTGRAQIEKPHVQ